MFGLTSLIAGIAGFATTTSVIVALLVVLVAYIAYEYAGPPLHRKMQVFRDMDVPYIPPLQARMQMESAFLLGRQTLVEMDTDQIKQYGTLHGRYDMGQAGLTVAEPDLLRDIFVKEFDCFYNRRAAVSGSSKLLDRSLFFERDKRWREIRAVVTPTFSTAKMRTMDGLIMDCLRIMRAEMEQKLDAPAEQQSTDGKVVVEVDAKDYFSGLTLDVLGTVFFGAGVDAVKNRDNPFVKNALAIFALPSPLRVLLWFLIPITAVRNFLVAKGIVGLPMEARKYFEDIIPQIIQARRQMPLDKQRRDFLNIMIHSREKAIGNHALTASGSLLDTSGEANESKSSSSALHPSTAAAAPLNDEEIAGQCFIFMIAGYETTATTLGFLFHELAMNQDVQQRVREEINAVVRRQQSEGKTENELNYDSIADMHFLDACVSETLRLYPPVPRLERECMQDCTLSNGLQVKKGVIVGIPVWYIQHSPENFVEPEKFDPNRFYDAERRAQIKPYTYMPFGQGPRNCVGMRFALLELKMTAAFVVRNYRVVLTEKTVHPVPLQTRVGSVRPLNTIVGFERL